MDIDYDTLIDPDDNDELLEVSDLDEIEQLDEQDFINHLEEIEGPGTELQNYIDIDNATAIYLEELEDKLKQGKLDDYSFALENLLIEYKQALLHRKFNIDNEEDLNKIKRIRELKKKLETEFIEEKIEEHEFNRKYYNLLDFEYKLLLEYEDYSTKSIKIIDQVPKTLNEKIDELIKRENNNAKLHAKQLNIEWPEKPKIIKKDSKKVKMKKFLTYYLELEKTKSLIDKQFYEGPETENILTIRELKQYNLDEKNHKPKIDMIDVLRMEKMSKILQNKTREELLRCITDSNLIQKLSYIEKLKLNTVPILKFREYPETYKKLQEILGEEAKYYKISSNDMMKDFTQKFYNISPDIELKKSTRTFTPVYFVKIKDEYHETIIPTEFDKDKKEIKKQLEKEYKINPSKLGYSFLNKVKKVNINKNQYENYSEYAEKGSVISISLKKEYFRSKSIIPGILDEQFYDIVKPLSDNLYNEIKSKNLPGNKTELSEVYELHVPIQTEQSSSNNDIRLVRRYENFEDYLTDLLGILEENMIYLETNHAYSSADILYIKIQKIKKYLETGIDHEYNISSKYTLDFIVKNDEFIEKQRTMGVNKLKEYIYKFYPTNEELVDVLENNVYDFNNKEYLNNIEKIIFIFNEFPDSLNNYITSNISFIDLVGMELPEIKPEDDLLEYYSDPKKTFTYLYKWKPKNDYYVKYKNELDSVGNDIIKFKKLKEDLSDLEINEIYNQMLENKQWEKSKIKLRKVIVPKHKNPSRVLLEFLKKERNKLSSRRIYRVAKIVERITVRQKFYRLFFNCNIQNFTSDNIVSLSESTENIIYSYCKKPEAYYYYVELVENAYTELCTLITEPKAIIPIMTEFIIKEGDFKYINIKRLDGILSALNSENLELIFKLILPMRQEELNAYQLALVEEQNREPTNFKQKLIKIIDRIIYENKQKKKEFMYSIAINTYISPILTNIVPKISTGADSFYVPIYYIIGVNQYLYGGNFPTFYNKDTGNRNYTDDNIYTLTELLKIERPENEEKEEDDKEKEIKNLHKLCMEKLELFSDLDKQYINKDEILKFDPTVVPKPKKFNTFINYTYRERLGVKSPGEVYIVYQDIINVTYAVPFKFNELGLPVYSMKFLQPDIKQFYYIEGPSEFEDTEEQNFLFSTMYILIEYIDKYGKVKLFREGVNYRKIKRSPKDNFDTCNRFKNEIDCDDINSYGLEKMKCKFIKDKCITIKEQVKLILPKLELLELSEVSFKRKLKKQDKNGKLQEVKDYQKMKLWNHAVKKANEYIAQLLIIKNYNEEEIKDIAKQQKLRLMNYYEFLVNYKMEKPQLDVIIEEVNYDNIKQLLDFIIPSEIKKEQNPEPEQNLNPEDIVKFSAIRLPYLITKSRALSSRQLVIGVPYLLPDDSVSILIDKPTRSEPTKLLSFDNGNKFNVSEVIIRVAIPEDIVEETTFKITKENLDFLYNPPTDFFYKIVDKTYSEVKKNIEIKLKYRETNTVPLDILYLTYLEMSSLNKNIPQNTITTDIIYSAMGKVMYCIYKEDSNKFLESLDVFPATLEAKIYSIKYSVNLLEVNKIVKGEIQVEDVIDYYNKLLPQLKTVKQQIISQLEYGLEHEDEKLLKKYIKLCEERSLINTVNDPLYNLYKLASDKLGEIKIEKEKNIKKDETKKLTIKQKEKIEELVPGTILLQEKSKVESKEVNTPSVSYMVKRKKNKKSEEDD
jgi:hypothetical protein